MYKYFIKRLFDVILSSILLIALSPIILIVSILLFFKHKSNPFFIQQRPGKNEKLFSIIKFRTMSNKKDVEGNLLPDSQRLTNVGKFIRSTSLDELPQLLNVIKGDMSLVGPRPLLPEYLPLYNEFQRERHTVRPGITGYAQVNGRNAISWEKKFELDIYYVKKSSFVLDSSILMKTIANVFSRKNINKSNTATAERFKGSQQQ